MDKSEFIKRLEAQGATYAAWEYDFLNSDYHYNKGIKPDDYIVNRTFQQIILGAFRWSKTIEGQVFWSNVYEEDFSNNNETSTKTTSNEVECKHDFRPTVLFSSTVYDCTKCGLKNDKKPANL